MKHDTAMTFTIEFITPELATLWLQLNEQNRRPRASKIAAFSSDMSCGLWRITHQPIAFDTNGKLKDGQHRLMAIAQSGKGQTLVVARNVPLDCFDAIDI